MRVKCWDIQKCFVSHLHFLETFRNFSWSREKSELFGFKVGEKHLLESGISSFFRTEFDPLRWDWQSNEWICFENKTYNRILFIDSSKTSLKVEFLLNKNTYASLTIAHSVQMKLTNIILQKMNDTAHDWTLYRHLKEIHISKNNGLYENFWHPAKWIFCMKLKQSPRIFYWSVHRIENIEEKAIQETLQ